MDSEEKPHLLFSAFAEVPGPGSLGTRVYQLVSVFSDDFDVDGITLKGKDLAHIQRLGTARMMRVPVDGKPFLERLSSFQRALQRQLTGDSYQLVYCADIFSAQIAAAFKESRGYALVVEVNDLPAESFTRGYPIDQPTNALRSTWKDIERQALRAADVVIAPSRGAARVLSAFVDPRRIQILSRAVDLTVFRPGETDLESGARATVVVVGRRTIANERQAALEILSRLAERVPESRVRLVLAGQSALGEDTMQHELVLSGLVGRVESVDIDSPVRLANALMEASVVVIPTKSEADIAPFAVPHRALEAMACRRATVLTGSAEAFSESLVPGREAVVVPPGRADEVAAAVVRLLDAPAERTAIALAGHARVVAQADLQKRMAEFAVIITEATGVRMTPRVPETTARGEWSASGAYSPDGFNGLADSEEPGLVGPSLDDGEAAVSRVTTPAPTGSGSGPSTKAMPPPRPPTSSAESTGLNPPADGGDVETARGEQAPVSRTMLADQPPSSDDWGGDTAIQPDGAFDSSAPSSEMVRPGPPSKPARAAPSTSVPPPLPKRTPISFAVSSTSTHDASRPHPPSIVVDGLANLPSRAPAGSVESDPFLTTGPSTRPDPPRPIDVRPSLDKRAQVSAPKHTTPKRAGGTDKRTVAEPPSGATSTAEPWPQNLGPIARAPEVERQETELIDAPHGFATDLPSSASAADPWAPDTVFDAVPLFPSGERRSEQGDDASAPEPRARNESNPPSTQAHAVKTKTASSFFVDRQEAPGAQRPATDPHLREGVRIPTLERAVTEPHEGPQKDAERATASDSGRVPAARSVVDRTRARAALVDDENLFSDADEGLGSDPDMTAEDAQLPSKPLPHKQ